MEKKFNYIAISNHIEHCLALQEVGVQQIMVDAEIMGKKDRQKNKNMVMSNHDITDVEILKKNGIKSEIICRINPYHTSIFNEIDCAISCGTDAIMLPMISNISHYKKMVEKVDNRCKIIPLIETPYSVFKLEEIIEFGALSQLHFGLNDLSIALGNKNLFEILLSKPFENIVKFASERVSLIGIGGVGTPLKAQTVSPELIFHRYYKMGSRAVILSRSFFSEGYNPKDIEAGIMRLEQSLEKNFTREALQNQINHFID